MKTSKKINSKWSSKEIEFLKANYELLTRNELAIKLGRTPLAVKTKAGHLELRKSPEAISRIAKRPNKGQFKKGQSPDNTLGNGFITLRMRKNRKDYPPYYWIRISKSNWKLLHVYLWEVLNGPVPKNNIVVFKDGNSLNLLIDNLEVITMEENMKRNSGVVNLPDKYVAYLIAGKKNKNLKGQILTNTNLINMKREQIKLNRIIKQQEDGSN